VLDIFYDYFYTFLHPFKQHDLLRKERELKTAGGAASLRLATSEDEIENDSAMSFLEIMSVSWMFMMVRTIYSVLSIYLGLMTYNYMSEDTGLSNLLLPQFTFSAQKIVLFVVLVEAVLYPAMLWLYTKFWGVLIRFFANLFEFEGDSAKVTEQVVNYSLVSNMFLIVPIFGELGKHLSSIIYLFAGLRKNMQLTSLQSVIVLASPILLGMLFILFIVLYSVMIFSIL
jgi:small-conductance mechanosensitive channel